MNRAIKLRSDIVDHSKWLVEFAQPTDNDLRVRIEDWCRNNGIAATIYWSGEVVFPSHDDALLFRIAFS